MMTARKAVALAGLAAALIAVLLSARPGAQAGGNAAVRIDADDIGGIVTSSKGSEANRKSVV